ncbi:hypothetical protein [Rhodoplanes roseus]|uniref:hypothetical protein n=1 Tax=Rhodoplanes roseus TaxID=29409 RepID=UPI0011B71BF3|nr:hypothetical protein [Rhodoplanes roseus]
MKREFGPDDWVDPAVFFAALRRSANCLNPERSIARLVGKAERDAEYRARLTGRPNRRPADAEADPLHPKEREALRRRSAAIRDFDALRLRVIALLGDVERRS